MAHTLSEINVLLLIARAAARETNANLMGNRHPSPASVFQLRLRKLTLVGFEIDNDFQISFFCDYYLENFLSVCHSLVVGGWFGHRFVLLSIDKIMVAHGTFS